MRKLKIIEHISLDGVIQAPGGPEEDTGSGFRHGGWSAPHHDAEAGKAIMEAHGDASVRALKVQSTDQSVSLVSMQRFRGTLDGRRGTFVLQGSEVVEHGKIKAS